MHGPGSPPRGRGKVDGPPAQVGRGRITPAQAGRSPYFLYGKKDYKDHPRIGGEKAELTAAVISAMGSPPRRRGKALHRVKNDLRYGITPAWAGKSTVVLPTPGYLWDHPRVGGEKILEPSMGVGNFGSPPHGRGKVVRSGVHRCCRGITPAWAGKRCSSGRCCMRQRDHPRVGGEKTENITPSIYEQGSPPRRRGKDKAEHLVQDHIGITPAQAGKRCYLCASTKSSWDHPRVGGEKAKITPRLKRCRGSPPRGRGKVVRPDVVAKAAGITPAWAGKSCSARCRSQSCGDHPRVGGEKSMMQSRARASKGSPPRGRGKGSGRRKRRPGEGITPAWAGKRARRKRNERWRQDHPRVGGEKLFPDGRADQRPGSPPRGRG